MNFKIHRSVLLKDPEFKKAYNDLDPIYQLIRQLIAYRIKKGSRRRNWQKKSARSKAPSRVLKQHHNSHLCHFWKLLPTRWIWSCNLGFYRNSMAELYLTETFNEFNARCKILDAGYNSKFDVESYPRRIQPSIFIRKTKLIHLLPHTFSALCVKAEMQPESSPAYHRLSWSGSCVRSVGYGALRLDVTCAERDAIFAPCKEAEMVRPMTEMVRPLGELNHLSIEPRIVIRATNF